jgi:hypothetical protein
MKRLTPKPHPFLDGYKHLDAHAVDIARLVAAAAKFGYQLSWYDAGELWRRYSDDLCASWMVIEVESDDQTLVTDLLKHAVVTVSDDGPPPPKGFSSWLDYAVATMDTRTEEQARMLDDDDASDHLSRDAMRDAARAELDQLRWKAGNQDN